MGLLLRMLPCGDPDANDDEMRMGRTTGSSRTRILQHYIASWLSVVETAVGLELL